MYSKILVPVDLMHTEHLDKAISTAVDLAKHYGIPICFASVTAETPTPIAHNPQEFAEKLKAFGLAQSTKHTLKIDTAAYPSHDPAVDFQETILAAANEQGADLIVMASHIPGFPEHIFASHAGGVASHANVSVFVIR